MKRSVQEIVELLVFGLIALLVGTALLWLVGWVFDILGMLLKFFAGLVWSLLRFIVPVAVVAAIVYALVRLVQQRRVGRAQVATPGPATPTPVEPQAGTIETETEESAPRPTASEMWAPPQPATPAATPRDDWAPEGTESEGPDRWASPATGSGVADDDGDVAGGDAWGTPNNSTLFGTEENEAELTGIAGTEATDHPAPLGANEGEPLAGGEVPEESAPDTEPKTDTEAETETESETDSDPDQRS
jgi:hypothetical protein